jgi:phospholipid transport system substrate-binding protein
MTVSARRRAALTCLALAALFPTQWARAADDPAATRIRGFYDALLDTMQHAKQLGVSGRYDKLAPVIRETFDLPAMTRIAVGPGWTSIPAAQQSALTDAFTRMTIATYASRFDGYSGERFEVEPAAEVRGRNRIVRTRLVESNGNITMLNYLMHESGSGWKVIDVYLSGTVSELATRRSEFASILKSGGADALLDSLRERTEKLMKGS